MVAMKLKKMVAMKPRRNGDNEAESSSFYKQLIVLKKKKKSGRDNTINCSVMNRIYVD